MNIIVTKSKISYDGFLSVATLSEACSTVGRIEFLVYTKSSESSEEKVNYLTELKDRVDTFIYICNEKDTDLAVKMVVVGTKGKYFDDEFFLESSAELNNLIRSLDDVTAVAEMGGITVISDFLNRYLKTGSSSFGSNYLVIVKDAVQTLMKDYSDKNLEVLRMSETATEIFASTSELVSGLNKEKEELKKSVRDVEEIIKTGIKPTTLVPSDKKTTRSILFFPRVDYYKEKNIIRIKEVGDFRYLISLTLGFRLYLEKVKNIRPKLIVITPIGELYEKIYGDYKWVTQSSYKNRKNYYDSVVFTNYPNKDVLTTLLDDANFDTFIVVDRTKTDKLHLLNSKGVVRYAISGQSVISKFKLPTKDCITSTVEIQGALAVVPMFAQYPLEQSERERFYMNECSNIFDLLYSIGRK